MSTKLISSDIKTCSVCGISKPIDEFYNEKNIKNGKRSECKECDKKYYKNHLEKRSEYNKKYYQDHREKILEQKRNHRQNHKEECKEYNKEYYQDHKDEIRKRTCQVSMYENKDCAAYLGIVIGERLIRHLFNDVEAMPYDFPDYDFICNKGKKINVKTACMTSQSKKYYRWKFTIRNNKIPDFFILVAFDNLTDLNLLHIWMIPGNEINNNSGKSIRPSTIHKWDKWKLNIKDAQLCCTEMKKNRKIDNHD